MGLGDASGAPRFLTPSWSFGLTALIFSFTVIDVVDAVVDSIVPYLISMSRMVNVAFLMVPPFEMG
jgi:hypothetical protein